MELVILFHQCAVDLQERGSFSGISFPAVEHEAVHWIRTAGWHWQIDLRGSKNSSALTPFDFSKLLHGFFLTHLAVPAIFRYILTVEGIDPW